MFQTIFTMHYILQHLGQEMRGSQVRLGIKDPMSQVRFFPYSFSLLFVIIMAFIGSQAYVAQSLFKQPAYANSNTNTTTIEAEEIDPAPILFLTKPTGNFNATGTISSSLFTTTNNRTVDPQYVLAGNWSALAANGNITDFKANFTMVTVDGKERHLHSITDFSSNVVAPLILDIHGTTFTGESDITTDGNVTWHAIQTTVTIVEHDVIKITLDEPHVNNHFHNQPIYGVVFSIQEYGSPQ